MATAQQRLAAQRAAQEASRNRAREQTALNAARAAAPRKGVVRPGQPAAPVAPAAPTPRGPLALPPDPVYDASEAAARSNRDTSLAGLSQQRTGQLIGYGYSEDPVSGALAFNPLDPFSKASLLKKTYDQSRARTAQSMGSTGGLYAGAFQQGQDIVNRGQVQGEDALQRSLTSWLAQNTAGRQRAQTKYETDVSTAAGASAGRASTSPLYSPEADISAATAVAAPAAAKPYKEQPGKSSAGVPGVWHIYPDGRKVFVARK